MLGNAASCICRDRSFTVNAQACLACSGGTTFTQEQLGPVVTAEEYCSTVGGGGYAPPGVSIPSGTASSSGLSGVTAVSSEASAIPVTENSTQPITISAWAPTEIFPTQLTYKVAATGGVNTTIVKEQTSVYSDSEVVATISATATLVLNPTHLLRIEGAGELLHITTCDLETEDGNGSTPNNGTTTTATNGTVAECIRREYSPGENATATLTQTFTLTGATSDLIVYPTLTIASGTLRVAETAPAQTAAPTSLSGPANSLSLAADALR